MWARMSWAFQSHLSGITPKKKLPLGTQRFNSCESMKKKIFTKWCIVQQYMSFSSPPSCFPLRSAGNLQKYVKSTSSALCRHNLSSKTRVFFSSPPFLGSKVQFWFIRKNKSNKTFFVCAIAIVAWILQIAHCDCILACMLFWTILCHEYDSLPNLTCQLTKFKLRLMRIKSYCTLQRIWPFYGAF